MNNDKRLSRQELLQWINAVSFAVNDVVGEQTANL